MNGANEPRCELERALERLGAAERAGAPQGLEARVFASSVEALHGAERPTVVARVGWARVRLSVAAALVGIGAVAAAWLTGGPRTPAAAPVAVESADGAALAAVQEWLSESPLGDREATMDDLFFAIAGFDPRSAEDWTLDDLLSMEGDSL